jgi:hypothetical protein
VGRSLRQKQWRCPATRSWRSVAARIIPCSGKRILVAGLMLGQGFGAALRDRRRLWLEAGYDCMLRGRLRARKFNHDRHGRRPVPLAAACCGQGLQNRHQLAVEVVSQRHRSGHSARSAESQPDTEPRPDRTSAKVVLVRGGLRPLVLSSTSCCSMKSHKAILCLTSASDLFTYGGTLIIAQLIDNLIDSFDQQLAYRYLASFKRRI